MGYPGQLDEAVAKAIAARQVGGLRDASDRLSAGYRKGGTSSAVDLAAYLAARLPATFAVNARVMAEVALALPLLAPGSFIDVGAGPGTAGWAALAQWPTLLALEQVEASEKFAAVLLELNASSGIPALAAARVHTQALSQWQVTAPTDLVVASYMLAELHADHLTVSLRKLWAAAGQVLVLIEPGTPDGFKRLLAARKNLLGQGAHVAGPCTHEKDCPMTGGDWCHFKQRVQRSRAHMHAKGATVPYEDEPFAWLALSRTPVDLAGGRVVMPAKSSKAGLDFTVCADGALKDVHVATRDKATYKRYRKADWGDVIL